MTQDGLNSALMEVARGGILDIVKLRISQGADVNAQDNIGNTSLHWAAMFGKGETVKVLLESGADADVENLDGNTPSDLAGQHGYEATSRMLNSAQTNQRPTDIREWITLDQARTLFPEKKNVTLGNYVALSYMCQLVNTAMADHLVANGVNSVLMDTMQAGVAAAAVYFSVKSIQTFFTKADRQIPQKIIDEVRATSEHAVARRDGKLGIWLVHKPESDAPVMMTESEFREFDKKQAAEGKSLAKISVGILGDVTVTRTLGGKLHADGMPALVVINPKTNERKEKWFSHGTRQDAPDVAYKKETAVASSM